MLNLRAIVKNTQMLFLNCLSTVKTPLQRRRVCLISHIFIRIQGLECPIFRTLVYTIQSTSTRVQESNKLFVHCLLQVTYIMKVPCILISLNLITFARAIIKAILRLIIYNVTVTIFNRINLFWVCTLK